MCSAVTLTAFELWKRKFDTCHVWVSSGVRIIYGRFSIRDTERLVQCGVGSLCDFYNTSLCKRREGNVNVIPGQTVTVDEPGDGTC